MPSIPLRASDLVDAQIAERFGETGVVDELIERHHSRPPDAPPPDVRKNRTTAVRKARGDVWDPKANILGAMWRPMIAPDIAKFTGIAIGTVCSVLIELEAKGRARKTGAKAAGWDGDLYDLWEKVVSVGGEST